MLRRVMLFRFLSAFWLGGAVGFLGGYELVHTGLETYAVVGVILLHLACAAGANFLADSREEPPWTG